MGEASDKENRKHFCLSCGRDIAVIRDSVIFKCPNCNSELARCGKCRTKGGEFTCKVCGLVGP